MSFNSITKTFVFKHFASNTLNSLWDDRSACAMEIICDELRRNNVEIDKETLSFHIHACLREHGEIYQSAVQHLDTKCMRRTFLYDIYEEMNPSHFGRLIGYLTLVYKIANSFEEDIVGEAVQRTVEDFKHIDLEKYKVLRRTNPFQMLLGQLFVGVIFVYVHM